MGLEISDLDEMFDSCVNTTFFYFFISHYNFSWHMMNKSLSFASPRSPLPPSPLPHTQMNTILLINQWPKLYNVVYFYFLCFRCLLQFPLDLVFSPLQITTNSKFTWFISYTLKISVLIIINKSRYCQECYEQGWHSFYFEGKFK